jgi:hypothetical protein
MASRAASMPYLPPQKRNHGQVTRWVEDVLHVFQGNTDARAFYERHGFTVLDTSDGRKNMENLPDMTMRWTPDSA